MIPPDYTALETGPCELHDHFGSGECPDCEIRRKLADALALAASLQDEIERLKGRERVLRDEANRLKGYVTHKPECLAGDPQGVIPCICGLAPETGAT